MYKIGSELEGALVESKDDFLKRLSELHSVLDGVRLGVDTDNVLGTRWTEMTYFEESRIQ